MNWKAFPLPALGLLILAAAMFAGCLQDNISREDRAEARTVQWPALRALDDLVHRVDHLVEDGETAALAELTERLREAIVQVADDPVPTGARNPEQVRVLQADLRSLGEALADAEALGGPTLAPAMQAVGPIVHALMQASALPHTHAQGGHDHGGESPMTLADLGKIEGPGHYGGTILEIVDDHSVHAELVVDPESGTMRVYALDEVGEPTRFDDPLSAELLFDGWTSHGRHVSVTLQPDASGLAYEFFEGLDENLRGAEWIAGRITGKFRGSGAMRNVATVAGWPPGGDDDHDHHDHDHGHDH